MSPRLARHRDATTYLSKDRNWLAQEARQAVTEIPMPVQPCEMGEVFFFVRGRIGSEGVAL
jgi:hypothetical protein